MNDIELPKTLDMDSIEALQARFKTDEWPEFLALERNDLAVEIRLSVPKSLSWFAGHFPGNPVLPGVVQTHWACELSKLLFSMVTPFDKITKLRFKTVVFPDTELVLILRQKTELKNISFIYKCGDTVISSGNVQFREVQ